MKACARNDTKGPILNDRRMPAFMAKDTATVIRPRILGVAISPKYMGIMDRQLANVKPESRRAAYIYAMLSATPMRIQAMVIGTAARRSVFKRPSLIGEWIGC